MKTLNRMAGLKLKCAQCGEFKADQVNMDVTGLLNGQPICVGCTITLTLASLHEGA